MNRKIQTIFFILLSLEFSLDCPSVNSQEVIDDYYLQQLQQLNGQGNNYQVLQDSNSRVLRSTIGEEYSKSMNSLADTMITNGCSEEAQLVYQVRDSVLENIGTEALEWSKYKIIELGNLCKLRRIGTLGK